MQPTSHEIMADGAANSYPWVVSHPHFPIPEKAYVLFSYKHATKVPSDLPPRGTYSLQVMYTDPTTDSP